MPFKLAIYPWICIARFNEGDWDLDFIEQEHLTPAEEKNLDLIAFDALMSKRNHLPDLPFLNYTTQYGLGCFEGLKAHPQKDGSLKLFRPDRNCVRMASSMKGLKMPAIPEDLLLESIVKTVRLNRDLGYAPAYDRDWEKELWQNADTVYVRPFSYSEPGIGVNLSKNPWVIIVCTTVSAYFMHGKNNAVTSKIIRATPNGTGWIKTAANYVASALAKSEAIENGYMECIFLDSVSRQNIEEGSSCNFFALFPNKTLITPALRDTILPGITRLSVIEIARDAGYTVLEEDLPVEKVLREAVECFVTGTAVGITPLSSLTHKDWEKKFSSMDANSTSNRFLQELKGIQFGALPDRRDWMLAI